MFAKITFYVSLGLVASWTHAYAQNANDLIRLFGGVMQNAIVQAALGEWKKIPESEAHCVDQALRQRGSSLESVLRQGITPSDTRIASVRSACRSITAAQAATNIPQPSQTQQLLWDHNGSTVYLVAQGRSRKFFYKQPREGLLIAGARPNELVFSGEVVGEQYRGVAYRFNSRCGKLPYQVSGPILDNYRRVELRGQAPRVDSNCGVTDYVDDLLVFQLIEPSIATSPIETTAPAPTPSQSPTAPQENAATILERIHTTQKLISEQLPKLRTPESRQKFEEIAARLATANSETSLSDLKTLQNDANSAVRISEEAAEFNRVSEIADQRIKAITAALERITSDAPIIQRIQEAIKTVKVAQSDSALRPLQDSLKTLNDLYDKNRSALRSMEFDSP